MTALTALALSALQVEGTPWPESGELPRRADDATRTIDSPTKIKKLLPSVKALKSQFESPAPAPEAPRRFKERSQTSSRMASEPQQASRQPPPPPPVAVADPAPASGQRVNPGSAGGQRPSAGSPAARTGGSKKVYIPDDPVEAIYDKFGEVDERMLKQKITTLSWDPVSAGLGGSVCVTCVSVCTIVWQSVLSCAAPQ